MSEHFSVSGIFRPLRIFRAAQQKHAEFQPEMPFKKKSGNEQISFILTYSLRFYKRNYNNNEENSDDDDDDDDDLLRNHAIYLLSI